MLVDASDVPPSSTLATVATLASVALLSCLLRLCARGGRLRSRGTDEWLLAVAAALVVADLVVVVLRVQSRHDWVAAPGDHHEVLILVWVETLVQILGFGVVKLSVAVTVLRCAVPSWHRYVVLGYICLMTILTVLWFGCALLFDGPIAVDWSAISEAETTWALLRFLNSVLDIGTTVLIALAPVPLLWTSHSWAKLLHHVVFVTVYLFTTAAIAAASLRTYLLYSDWQKSATDTTTTNTPLIAFCSSIELALGVLSASLFALSALLPQHPRLSRALSKRTHTSASSTPPSYPTNTYASTDTVIRHPAPSLLTLRFHDTESNLDFDMATTHSRSYPQTRTQTLQSQVLPHEHARSREHTRNVSDWSQFSGFTYYSTPAPSERHSTRQSARQSARQSVHEQKPSARQSARQSLLDAEPPQRHSSAISVSDLDTRTRRLGGARAGADRGEGEGPAIGIAVTTLGSGIARGEVEGEEMRELARLFADKSQAWGCEDREADDGVR